MMRVGMVVFAVMLAACAACPRPIVGLGTARVEDRARGLPKPIVETSAVLLDRAKMRRCQVLFEPAFSSAHAVWLVHDDATADATVFVTVSSNDEIRAYSAALDRNTALRLSQLCLASLTSRAEACGRLGADGVWYHAAHPTMDRSYAMASFWSPRPGTVASDFVRMAEALRNYATLPETLRSPAWLALQEAAGRLSERLANAG